jgi:hypothetical protein
VLYDCLGRTVTELFRGTVNPGFHEITVNMVNARGEPLPAGGYMVRATIGTHAAVKKLVRVN